MYLYELKASAIDRELEDTARNLGKSSGPMDDPDDPLGGEPDSETPELDNDDEELNVAEPKKIDSVIISGVKDHPYATEYRHRGDSKIEPFKIVQLELDQLNQLRQLVRNKISMNTFKDQFGLYADPSMKFYQDLINFVEDVIDIKDNVVKNTEQKKSDTKKPKIQQQEAPKTKPGKIRKPNRGGK